MFNDYFVKQILFLQKKSDLWVVVVLSLLALLIKVPLVPLGTLLLKVFNLQSELFSIDNQIPTLEAGSIFLALIVAPIFETFIGQWAPISLLNKMGKNIGTQIIVSSTVFALFHLPVVEFIPSAFIVGVVFALAFLRNYKYKVSVKKAFVICTLVHFLHNFYALLATTFLPA